jgi:hypothetical protein
MTGKYSYICYCDVDTRAASPDKMRALFAKEDELAKKYGVEIVLRGTPFGVSASYVTIYRTDKYIDDLMNMIMETGRSEYVSSSTTIPVTPLIFRPS